MLLPFARVLIRLTSTGESILVAARIVVKGASGSGKTTLAGRLAEQLGLPHVELDALHHGPNWSEPPLAEFRRRVAEATTGDRWVVDGNYDGKVGDILVERADLVVWLDPPLRTILGRLLRRTLSRNRMETELWAGNRETWRGAFLGSDSLFSFAIRTHRRLRRELPAQAKSLGVDLVRLRSTVEVEQWFAARGGTLT